ncbi:MAG: hypothetical protein JWN15_2359, partial [Firmicutes bacterium]|nr:hypothetical protein [Bacillota bacterium]
ISQELDRLVVEFARHELNNSHEGAQQ